MLLGGRKIPSPRSTLSESRLSTTDGKATAVFRQSFPRTRPDETTTIFPHPATRPVTTKRRFGHRRRPCYFHGEPRRIVPRQSGSWRKFLFGWDWERFTSRGNSRMIETTNFDPQSGGRRYIVPQERRESRTKKQDRLSKTSKTI
jgi:hypothetical protein